MRGIIENLLHNLKSFYLRTLLFNNDTRVYFYASLREYLKSHFPLLTIFNHIQQQSKNPALHDVAKLSKRAIRNNQPFARVLLPDRPIYRAGEQPVDIGGTL